MEVGYLLKIHKKLIIRFMFILPPNFFFTHKENCFNSFAVWYFQPLYNKEGKILRFNGALDI